MRDNKLEKILEVATEFIGSEGYHGTSFQKIADKVGVHKSTLFHYVKSKRDLLLLILEQAGEGNRLNLERISELSNSEPEEKLRLAIRNHLSSVIGNIRGVNVYFNELKMLPQKYRKVYTDSQKRYQRGFLKIIIEMKKKGHFEGLDAKIVTFGILGMLNSIPRWYKAEGQFSLDEISEILWKLIVKQ